MPYKIRLMDVGIIRKNLVNGAMRIRSEKIREHQYIKFSRCLESNSIGWNKDGNVEQM